jgi:hypothetical protein
MIKTKRKERKKEKKKIRVREKREVGEAQMLRREHMKI